METVFSFWLLDEELLPPDHIAFAVIDGKAAEIVLSGDKIFGRLPLRLSTLKEMKRKLGKKRAPSCKGFTGKQPRPQKEGQVRKSDTQKPKPRAY